MEYQNKAESKPVLISQFYITGDVVNYLKNNYTLTAEQINLYKKEMKKIGYALNMMSVLLLSLTELGGLYLGFHYWDQIVIWGNNMIS